MAGLYLAKFDSQALHELGFAGFTEAFNVLGFATGSKPASVKNYRDEFDPLLPNARRGWHKRPIREYCLRVFERYGSLDFESFTELIKSLGEGGEAAETLQERFFLFVVKNFRETPFHEIHNNPLAALSFRRAERTIVQVCWTAGV